MFTMWMHTGTFIAMVRVSDNARGDGISNDLLPAPFQYLQLDVSPMTGLCLSASRRLLTRDMLCLKSDHPTVWCKTNALHILYV